MSSQSNKEKVSQWSTKMHKECVEAAAHQLHVSELASLVGNKEASGEHRKCSEKFSRKAKLLESKTFKTIQEGEQELDNINR